MTIIEKFRLNQIFKILFYGWWDAFKHFFYFKGRTNRVGFWGFTFLNSFILFFLFCLDEYFHLIYRFSIGYYYLDFRLFFTLYFFLTFAPACSVSIRRLHDINFSGWWGLLILFSLPFWGIKFLFQLSFLIVTSMPSADKNKYGIKPTDQMTV